MCGPIAAYSAKCSSRGTLRYQIGRAIGYAMAGGGAGLLGQPLVHFLWDSDLTTALSWALALLMASAAYRAWPRSPSQSIPEEPLVQLHSAKTRDADADAKGNGTLLVRLLKRFPAQPLLLGGFSVLIPCAALWGGLVIAASSASLLGGALAMSAFSLTSSTGLLATSFFAGRLRKRPSHHRVLSLIFALGAVALVLRPITMHLQSADAKGGDETAAPHCPLHPGGAP